MRRSYPWSRALASLQMLIFSTPCRFPGLAATCMSSLGAPNRPYHDGVFRSNDRSHGKKPVKAVVPAGLGGRLAGQLNDDVLPDQQFAAPVQVWNAIRHRGLQVVFSGQAVLLALPYRA